MFTDKAQVQNPFQTEVKMITSHFHTLELWKRFQSFGHGLTANMDSLDSRNLLFGTWSAPEPLLWPIEIGALQIQPSEIDRSTE
jgi:hypothetical protein